MFWRLTAMRSEQMDENGNSRNQFLIINRAQVLDSSCSACGARFAESPSGDKTLIATVSEGKRTFFFCAPCGDNIMGRVQIEDARGHYGWDWAIPVRNGDSHES
jgi:hypothetical protein